jgi:ubiquinone/menaquinone biosynthesis C-methylase UbiE
MNKNEKQSIKKYDSIASDYDSSFDGRFTAKFKEKMLEFCEVSKGDKVLDVGCGNGSLLFEISRKTDVKTFGVDISPKMIEVCRQKYENINFETTTGEKLPFDNNTFDLLTICCVLHHLNNPQNFFNEAYRVLKSGGILIVGEPCFPLFIRKIMNWIVSPLIKAGDNKLFSQKQLKRLFENSNFSIINAYKKGVTLIIKARKI